jgi:hypothetical protein
MKSAKDVKETSEYLVLIVMEQVKLIAQLVMPLGLLQNTGIKKKSLFIISILKNEIFKMNYEHHFRSREFNKIVLEQTIKKSII